MTPQHQPQATPHFREPYYQDSAANSLSADTFVRMEEGKTNTINSVQDCWMQILRLREDLNTECRCGASAKKQLAITEAGITTPLDTVYPAPMPLTTTPIMNFHHITSRLLNFSVPEKSHGPQGVKDEILATLLGLYMTAKAYLFFNKHC